MTLIKATSLTFKYSEPEDRLIVLASEPAGGKIGRSHPVRAAGYQVLSSR